VSKTEKIRSQSQTPRIISRKVASQEKESNNQSGNETKELGEKEKHESKDHQLTDDEIMQLIEEIQREKEAQNTQEDKTLAEEQRNDQQERASHCSRQSQLKGVETRERVKLLLMRSMSADKLRLHKNELKEHLRELAIEVARHDNL